MAWCFEDEATPAADAVLDGLGHEEAVVPWLRRLEVADVLLAADRRRRISEATVARFVALLTALPIRVDPDPAGMTGLLAAGPRPGLSAYDACYLVLAERLGVPLATVDEGLAAGPGRRRGRPRRRLTGTAPAGDGDGCVGDAPGR